MKGHIQCANNFFHSVGSFHFIEGGLPLKQKVLNFDKVHFIYIFILLLVLLVSYFRNHCIDLLLYSLLNVLNLYLFHLGLLSIQS